MEFMTNLQSGLDDQKPSLFGKPSHLRNTNQHTTDTSTRTSIRATTRGPHTTLLTLPPRHRNTPPPPLPPPHPQLVRRNLRLHLPLRRTPLPTYLRRRLHRELLRSKARKSTPHQRPRDPSRLPRSSRTSPRNLEIDK
jgi:hypothetical protein